MAEEERVSGSFNYGWTSGVSVGLLFPNRNIELLPPLPLFILLIQ